MPRAKASPAALLACVLFGAACGPGDGREEPNAATTGSALGELSEAGLPTAAPADVGMSGERLSRIRPAVQAYVDDGRLAGVMTMVARHGRVVHWEAVGMRDLEAGDALEPDDLFRVYSMTKPVTTVAAMILVEEGKVELDDPVSKFIPQFGDVTVLNDAGERVAPTGPITVEHLMTHTSGLTYGFFGDTPVDRLYNESGVFSTARSLDDFVSGVAELPLLADPGARWNYSVSTDVLGRIVEVASGEQFDEFVKERILDPLEMDDTDFWVPPEKRSRFTANYELADGVLQVMDSPVDGRYTEAPPWLSGGHGLASTASDYIRFAQMLLLDGHLGDVRILEAETVEMMRANRLPDALVPIDFGIFLSPAYGFGLGFAVLVDEDASAEPDNNGVFRWAGAANTFFWIDPEADLVGMVWTQLQPFGIYDIEREFQTLVYESLE